jgi:hypothetical protein
MSSSDSATPLSCRPRMAPSSFKVPGSAWTLTRGDAAAGRDEGRSPVLGSGCGSAGDESALGVASTSPDFLDRPLLVSREDLGMGE